MSKEKVFIVVSHKRMIKKSARVGARKPVDADWETAETIEFVNRLTNKHISMSSAIADYLGRTMISGKSRGMDSYEQFETYIHTKYPKQLAELDSVYKEQQIVVPTAPSPDIVVDDAGNIHPRTVFDNA